MPKKKKADLLLPLGPHVWKVIFFDELESEGMGIDGRCDSDAYEIHVVRRESAEHMADTVLHELGHAIEYAYGWETSENRVQTISSAFLQALRPWLSDFLARVGEAAER